MQRAEYAPSSWLQPIVRCVLLSAALLSRLLTLTAVLRYHDVLFREQLLNRLCCSALPSLSFLSMKAFKEELRDFVHIMKKLTVSFDSKDIGSFPFGLRLAILWKKRMRDS